MNSIRSKLFLQIGSIVLILVALLILTNSLFLDDYYVFIHKNNIIKIYDTIKLYEGPYYKDDISSLLFNENKVKIEVLIRNQEGIVYSSNPQVEFLVDPSLPKRRHDSAPPKLIETKVEVIDETTFFRYAIDQNSKMQFVFLDGRMTNGDLIYILMPVESVLANSRIVNDFLLIIGSVVFILAMSVAYIISKTFTKPILRMNDATKSMIDHNFNVSCQVDSNDEIGQLATSINELAVALDNSIEDLKVKNIALEKQIDETNRLAIQRKVLLGNVSHELKTPLALIQGYAEGLEVLTDSDAKAKNYASIIHDESDKMNTLISKLLDIDQLESDTLILDPKEFDLVSLIQSQLLALEGLLKTRECQVHLDLPASISVLGDPILIERVIMNLLTNALYHSMDKNSIHIKITNEDNIIRTTVSNKTDSIPEVELHNLFDSFYKLDKARTRHKGGHGLGLSIVKAIIEAHLMNYGVYQEEDNISFWFELERQN